MEQQFKTVFNSCLNVLRDNEVLIGDNALRNISYLLTLKLIEPQIDREIDLSQCVGFGDESHLSKEHWSKLLEISRFSVLKNEKEENLHNNITLLWEYVLSKHRSTEKIFLPNKNFEITKDSTFKRIIEHLDKLDLANIDFDLLGDAYTKNLEENMKGKVLGQFFTPPKIKSLMMELIVPQIYEDGTFESCCDPTLGTGGFLITYLKYVKKQAKAKNIKLNWSKLCDTYLLFGKEIEPSTYQLAMSNILISTGHIFSKMELGDSIREPITQKFDNVMANPPFGIKGLNYDEIKSRLRNEYLPIKSNNAVSLFLQAIIYMLKINGKCAIVLPDGQDLYSKTNRALVAVREYLLKTCDLKEIIFLPGGLFEFTSIKTCIFFFVKRKEGREALETVVKYNSSQKEVSRQYKFNREHTTKSVKFYNYDFESKSKNLIVEVEIHDLEKNGYALNYSEYVGEKSSSDSEIVERGRNEEFEYEVKTLGEICEINYGKSITKTQLIYNKILNLI